MTARPLFHFAVITALAACSSGGLNQSAGGVYAPGVAGESAIDGLIVGHRLMAAGEYELALDAYIRAAGQQGLNVDTLSGGVQLWPDQELSGSTASASCAAFAPPPNVM